MSRLRDLQQAFRDHVLDGSNWILPQIDGSESVSAEVRLGIYADGYRLRLLEALENDYPGLHKLVGSDGFDQLGLSYIESHPSSHFNLRWYGGDLAKFLDSSEPYSARPVLAEMAKFEWAMTLTFDAPDESPVSLSEMGLLPPEAWPTASFSVHPSVQRFDLRWNVPALWNAMDSGAAVLEPEQQYDAPQAWVMWRNNLKVLFRSLSAEEAWAMDAMIAGEDFSGICTGLCEWMNENEVSLCAASFLKRWVVDALIGKIVSTS